MSSPKKRVLFLCIHNSARSQMAQLPVKEKPGYAKFLPKFAPINLALSAGDSGRGSSVDRLGFQVESREVVRELLESEPAAASAQSTCCVPVMQLGRKS